MNTLFFFLNLKIFCWISSGGGIVKGLDLDLKIAKGNLDFSDPKIF